MAKVIKTDFDEFYGEPDADGYIAARDMLEKDLPSAIRRLLVLANNGSVASMLTLGYAYSLGVPDLAEQEHWYSEAHRHGSKEAAFKLGLFHYNQKEFAHAKRYLSESVNDGNVSAMYWLAKIHLGEGSSNEAAQRLLGKASDLGNLEAEFLLAQAGYQGAFGFGKRLPSLVKLLLATKRIVAAGNKDPDIKHKMLFRWRGPPG